MAAAKPVSSSSRAASRTKLANTPSECLSDLGALGLWCDQAGSNMSVAQAKLVDGLSSRFSSQGYPASFFDDLVCSVISSPAAGGAVTCRQLADFLERFGPTLSDAVQRSASSLFDSHYVLYPWFHGSISRTSAEAFLREPVDGRFLVRFSETLADKLSISYNRKKDGKMYIKNILIHCTKDGFALDPDADGGGASLRPFASVVKLIEANAFRLVTKRRGPTHCAAPAVCVLLQKLRMLSLFVLL
jgi:hypothetical protein